ncbi:MAG: NADPH-dependent glutamate synthase [Erysipelotrichales bacterium]|nr:NADPH-dependent glutamate synthase [Erysipelotrichales bacterium]
MNKRTVTNLLKDDLRLKSFAEVDLGYSLESAILEAKRCLACKTAPCEQGCPVKVKIKDFIREVRSANIDLALEKISEDNILPAICGRVCPQETQCEKHCVLGLKNPEQAINIGKLERFVGDYGKLKKEKNISANGIKVAIIGSGPAGMTCAGELAKKGFEVTVFEALHEAGGVLTYGIPEFRLPKKLIVNEWHKLTGLGVKLETNVIVGKTITIKELETKGFKEFFVATGAGLPKGLNIKGENLTGVYYANGFLTRINLMKAYKQEYHTPYKAYKHVVVIGGGNVALDAARTAKRLGAEVTIVYRRSKAEMPARLEEVKHAEEEGIEFNFLMNPKEIKGTDKVEGLLCEKMILGEVDQSGRASFKPTGEVIGIKADMVIIAVGQSANPSFFNNIEIERNKYGNIVVDEKQASSYPNLYAGGDIVTGASTVIEAMGHGKLVADIISKKYNK